MRELDQQLGAFDPEVVRALGLPNPPVEEIRAKIKAMEGSSGFMRFGPGQALGNLLPFVGRPAGKVVQYVIGNPLIAVQMTQYQPGVALYVPLRVLISEAEGGGTRVEYDLPSSLMAQFEDARVSEVARGLDKKLEKLIATALGGG